MVSSATSLCATPAALSARTRPAVDAAGCWSGMRCARAAATCASSASPAVWAAARSGSCSSATTASVAVPVTKSWWSARVSRLICGAAASVMAWPAAPSAVAKISDVKNGLAASRVLRFTSARLP